MSEAPRGSKELERPVVLDCIDLDENRTQFRFAFEGLAYDVVAPTQSQSDFEEWLPSYAAATPRCACCERVIFPGQPVTLGHVDPGDTGHSHYSPDCNDTAAGFAGSFNINGELGLAEAA